MSKSLVAAIALVAAGAHAADFKAAYVDIQRALQETDEGRAAKTRLQALVDQKQKAMEKEKSGLQAEVEAFQKQAPTMDDKVRAVKEQELQKKTYEFAQKAEKLRGELGELERKELGSIMPKLEQLLGQIAQREGLTMVFDKSSSGLAWAPASLDLTNEVIRMYNAQFRPGGAAAPGKPTAEAPKADAPKADAPKADAPKK
jgi:outer membrane protein